MIGLIFGAVNLFLPFVYGTSSSPFWPQPQDFSLGAETLTIDKNFHFLLNQQSPLLSKALIRYEQLISSTTADGSLKSCQINVVEISSNEIPTLQLNVDESYSLSINQDGTLCTIDSQTVWGALYALETFTQLLLREKLDGKVYLTTAPVVVTDTSRFSHRGILIDTSRHYIPLEDIRSFIDTLPMNKFNVLHWHMVDAQSFPIDTPSAPKIVQGAYTPSHVYTVKDVEMITEYAAERGVRILAEIDIPGHAASWAQGYPEIMADCFEKYYYNINNFALDPTKEETYQVVESVVSDLIQAMTDKHFHLGGDEVVYGW
jgi:hexosaminidase